MATAERSTRSDAGEENHFRNQITIPYGVEEMFQPELTHASASVRSRLDRIYCNQHTSEQLDRHFRVAALEWCMESSNHRAVVFARMQPHKIASSERKITAKATNHDDFRDLLHSISMIRSSKIHGRSIMASRS